MLNWRIWSRTVGYLARQETFEIAPGQERKVANPICRPECSHFAPVQHVSSLARQHQSLMAAGGIIFIISFLVVIGVLRAI
jgi:hypothetical protein